MQKEIANLREGKENKSKQIAMLYAVIEDRLNVPASYDDIEIRRVEARRMEKQQKDVAATAEAAKDKGRGIAVENEEVLESLSQQEQQLDVEVNDENALVLAQLFVLVGESKSVSYKREDNARRIEVERSRLKAKQAKKYQTVEKVDEEKDDEDEEDDDLKDSDDYPKGGDDDDDDNDDDDQGGDNGALIVRQPGANQLDDYFNGE
ncbi:hypothetical protein Hanom_Chr05g00404931 [Helianthus anomalus]